MSKNTVSFTGLRTGKISNLLTIKSFSDCHLDGIYYKLKDKVSPDFIQEQGTDILYKKANSLADTLKYPFTRMPLEFLNSFANKFNIKSLQNGRLLTNFKQTIENEQYERAMRGLLQISDNAFNDIIKKNNIGAENVKDFLCQSKKCNKAGFAGQCDNVADKFYKLFDENLSKSKAHYNTPHERTVVKIVSGTTAALMMGNDFYNKSILNGKSEDEAKASADGKIKQELIESGQEALAQYFTLGAFSEFTNNHTLGAPILNTALSTIFRITSRVSTGRPLTKIKIPEKIKSKLGFISLTDFAEAAKNKQSKDFVQQTQSLKEPEKEKKHLLSLKNIGLACLASIGIGFALKGAKSTKTFEKIEEAVKNSKPVRSIHNAMFGEKWITKNEIDEFGGILRICKHKDMEKYYQNKFDKLMKNPSINKDGKTLIGEYEKTLKIPFTKILVSRKELMQVPLIPFKIAFEFASYPYKAAHKILEGITGSEKVANAVKNIKNDNVKKHAENFVGFFNKKPDKVNCNLINTYMDFEEQLQKHGGMINDEFIEFYQKHIDNNWISALNKETQSGVNNAAIGKLTSLLGTFASLYFAMTDDFNETAKQTGDKEKAEKDARLRGLNKIIRMTTQIAFMDILNGAFKIPYAQSILGAGIITAACTVLTDSVSRVLSGMPFKKMNKEELEAYNKNKKEGLLNGYYNALDKLTD